MASQVGQRHCLELRAFSHVCRALETVSTRPQVIGPPWPHLKSARGSYCGARHATLCPLTSSRHSLEKARTSLYVSLFQGGRSSKFTSFSKICFSTKTSPVCMYIWCFNSSLFHDILTGASRPHSSLLIAPAPRDKGQRSTA